MIETIQVNLENKVTKTSSGRLASNDNDEENKTADKKEVVWKTELVWSYIIYYSAIHIGAIYGLYRLLFCNVSWLTLLFSKK